MARRLDVKNIPDWVLPWVDRYCDRKGISSPAQLVRSLLVKVAEDERNGIFISSQGDEIQRYREVCKRRGYSAETSLSLFIQQAIRASD